VWYISNEVKEALMHYDWPGNVRELENIIESAINMINKGHIIKPEHISPDMYKILFKSNGNKYSFRIDEKQPLDRILEEVEKSLILEAMQNNDNNISKSSEKLGIKRQTLQHKLKKYGIKI
jgi:arginine utilization regulatory protein